ncbi:OKR_DC_1 domain-containing protein [Senna tora]|uniref:OKR_DC_1 domain-containing protein n=1 Tax=Senna tora TaxID=362788 RepID=A0A834SI95_9FABA|nr:OKR_DC_1 domain-containing protein [Senna tora]
MAKLNSTYENSWQRVSDSLTRVEALMKQLYFLKFGEEWDEVQAAELKSRSDVERDTQDEDLRLGSVISLTSKSEEDEQEEINIGAVILEPEAEVTEASVDLRSEHLNDEQFGSYEVSDVHVSPCDMEVNDRRYSKVFNAGTTNLEMGTECVEDEVIIDCSNVEATQADDEQEEVKTVAMIQSNANWKILLESVGSTDVNVLAVPIEIDAKFGCVYDAHEVLDEWYDRDTITNSTKVTEMDWGNKKIKIMGESFGFEEIWFLVGALTCEINAATVSTCSKTKIYGSPNLLSTAPKTYKHEDSSLAWMALSVLDVFILDKEKENFSIARFKSFPFDPGGCWYSNLYWTDVSYTELNLEDKVVFEDWDISTGAFIESFAMAKLNSTYENSWQRVSDSLTRVEALMKQLYFLKFGEEWDEVQAAELKSRSDVERDTQDEDLRLGSVISLTSKSEEDEQEEINIGAVILEPEAEVTEASVDLRSEHLNDEQFGSYEVSDVHVSPCDMEVNDRRYSKVFNAGTTNLEMGTECVEDEVIIDCSNVEATQADDEQEEVKTVAMIQSNANWKILLESVGSTDVNVLAVPIEIDAKFGCVYDAHEVLDEWYDRDTITNSTKVTEMDWGNKKIKIMGESFGFEEIWFLVGALTCEINAATVSTCSKSKMLVLLGNSHLLTTSTMEMWAIQDLLIEKNFKSSTIMLFGSMLAIVAVNLYDINLGNVFNEVLFEKIADDYTNEMKRLRLWKIYVTHKSVNSLLLRSSSVQLAAKIYGSPNLLSTAPKTYKHEDSSLAWMALSVLDVFILDKEKENFSIARFKSFPFDPGGCWYSNLYWTDVSYTELNLEDKVVFEDWGIDMNQKKRSCPIEPKGRKATAQDEWAIYCTTMSPKQLEKSECARGSYWGLGIIIYKELLCLIWGC